MENPTLSGQQMWPADFTLPLLLPLVFSVTLLLLPLPVCLPKYDVMIAVGMVCMYVCM